jgi:large subunit ribosomal protein L19
MAAHLIQTLEAEEIARVTEGKKIPSFQPGDTLRVNVKIKEGDRERVQAFEGLCIARSGTGVNENFTVRKLSFGEGVERVFPLNSPSLDSIEVRRQGKVRRQALLPARPDRQTRPYRRKDPRASDRRRSRVIFQPVLNASPPPRKGRRFCFWPHADRYASRSVHS